MNLRWKEGTEVRAKQFTLDLVFKSSKVADRKSSTGVGELSTAIYAYVYTRTRDGAFHKINRNIDDYPMEEPHFYLDALQAFFNILRKRIHYDGVGLEITREGTVKMKTWNFAEVGTG